MMFWQRASKTLRSLKSDKVPFASYTKHLSTTPVFVNDSACQGN